MRFSMTSWLLWIWFCPDCSVRIDLPKAINYYIPHEFFYKSNTTIFMRTRSIHCCQTTANISNKIILFFRILIIFGWWICSFAGGDKIAVFGSNTFSRNTFGFFWRLMIRSNIIKNYLANFTNTKHQMKWPRLSLNHFFWLRSSSSI